MTTHRMLPPSAGGSNTVNGRTYTCAAGSYLDVPDFDALILEANGWVRSAGGGVGATTARPVSPFKGMTFHDSTLGYNIVFDGKVWRNPTSGVSV